jgi:ABC-type glycerol-3-phosphate transport system substrate-binding protein
MTTKNTTNFQTGRVVMTVEGSPLGGTMMDPDKSKMIGKAGFGLIPSKGPGGHFPPFTAQGWLIPEGSNHKEAAWLNMQWMTSSTTVKKIALNTNFTAVARKSVFQDADFVDKYDYDFGAGSFLDVYRRTVEIAPSWYLPDNPEWPEIGDLLGNALNSVIVGAKDVDTAFSEAQSEATRILRKAGYFEE